MEGPESGAPPGEESEHPGKKGLLLRSRAARAPSPAFATGREREINR